jgi:hypothetical protein
MFGSRAAFAKPRDERRMKANLKNSELFPDSGPTSTAWMHKKLEQIKRGNEGGIARTYRMAQEDLLTARLDEERQLAELTRGRRPGLIGEGGRARAAQRAAEQVFNP